MRPDGNSARLVNHANRPLHLKRHMMHIGLGAIRNIRTEKIFPRFDSLRGEFFGINRIFHHSLSNVGTRHHSSRPPPDLIVIHGKTETLQFLYHSLSSMLAFALKLEEKFTKRAMLVIYPEAKDVNPVPAVITRHLDPGDYLHAELPSGGLGFVHAADGVMIGDGKRGHTVFLCHPNAITRRKFAVGGRSLNLKINHLKGKNPR